MTEWQYRKIDLNDLPRKADDIDVLNEAGGDRWELAGITANNFAYLKRQIAEPPTAKTTRRKTTATSTEP
jgi:hypothetical protein